MIENVIFSSLKQKLKIEPQQPNQQQQPQLKYQRQRPHLQQPLQVYKTYVIIKSSLFHARFLDFS